MSTGRPWTRSKIASSQGRPMTRGKQRGFYSEIVLPEASKQLQDLKKGPNTHHSNVWKSQRDTYLPSVTKFKTPDDFLDQLNSQVYGPTTQLLNIDEFSKVAWSPKVQVPFKVDSGCTPRKLEIERRKRQYNKQAKELESLLKQHHISTQELMPITDKTSRALLNFKNSSTQRGKQPTPTFPSFLPLEIFDNTEFDCRTPEEWVNLGYEPDGKRKPVPGKALLPVLELHPPMSPPDTPKHITPTPPTGDPPQDPSRPQRRYKPGGNVGTKSNTLPPLQSKSTESLKQKFEWVDIGMIDYNPTNKLFLVKRVHVPNHILQAKSDGDGKESKDNSDSGSESDGSGAGVKSDNSGAGVKSDGSGAAGKSDSRDGQAGVKSESSGAGDRSEEGEAGKASDGDQTASQPQTPKQQVAGRRKASKDSDRHQQAKSVESEDCIHYWLPRVRIMFAAEDPTVFAERVAFAHKSRQKTEALLRYHLYVDCMPSDGLQEIDREALVRVMNVAKSSKRLREPCLDGYSDGLSKEVQLEFTRSMNRILFDKTVTSQPGSFPFVTLPDPEVDVVPEKGKHNDVPPFPFSKIREKFQFLSILTSSEAISVLEILRAECGRVCDMSLFHTGVSKHLKLEEFDSAQQQASVQVQTYLTETWVSNLRSSIYSCLEAVRKGWFNLEETNFEVYQGSKLKKLMELIKFSMQDSVRSLVLDSIKSFVDMISSACVSIMDLSADFKWTLPLTESPYKPLHGALFYMELLLDKNGCHYTTDLDSFQPTLVSVFDRGINATHSVPQLEKFIVDKLFWPETALLEAVGLHEPQVDTLRDKISSTISAAIIPMKAYAQQYMPYLDLMNLDIDAYIKGFSGEEEKSTAQIKAEIDSHLEGKSRVEASLPQSIIIGPFFINTDAIRLTLAKKHKDIAKALLDFLVNKLRKDTEKICDDFKEIAYKLRERSNTIEDLTEQREYIKSVPELVNEFQTQIDQAMGDYDLIEQYFYPLSDDDFNNRWDTLAWNKRIIDQIEISEAQIEQDEQKFHKKLLDDQTQLEDKLDTLQMIVAGFCGRTDLSKAAETSNEVRRVVKDLKECQAQAVLYNQRERLFEMPVTQYDKVGKLTREFEPFKNLWLTAADWLKWYETWMNDSLINVDPELLATNVNSAFKVMHKSVKHFKDIPECLEVASEIKKQIEDFRPYIPLIQGLRNPGMRNRHWQKLSEDLGIVVQPKPTLTFTKCLEMGLDKHIEVIAKVAEVAGKEFSIEQALDKMEAEWEPVLMDIIAYKETGTFIMKTAEETAQMLDDHIVMTQAMSFSPYKKPFEGRITTWENKLRTTQDVMEEWVLCQRSWLYLEPIFSSDDIMRQLPVEGKRYQTMDRMWRKIMQNAKSEPKVISFCSDNRLLENFRECNKLLDQVQKGLSDYLETKRIAFPRFYFLSDDELLEILSQTKDPTAVQPHLRKCFENISKLQFEEDLAISKMFSGEGEVVPFSETIYPTGNVEDWLLNVEELMQKSLKQIIKDALEDYDKVPRTEWVLKWPGQVVIAGCQTTWTTEVSQSLQDGVLTDYYQTMLKQLADLVTLVRGKLTKLHRTILSALIVIEVHARDVVNNMLEEKVKNVNDFEWISQLRYYWEDELLMRAVNAQFNYGYEYLGNTGRLVITPLTDRCYLTLTGALHLKFGGAPAGPAGTGKTETVKDLAKAMAIQCVVFNCSDQLDFMAMGKFFKGLASSGAWACFDEFNRIDIEVLSVVAQQITTIQIAQQQRLDRFLFEGMEIALKTSCAVFVTMNPGYAGRTELPDNLKALFRPVAMMVPNYAMIAEIMLFSFGFSDAKVLSKKITTTFKLSSEQLSSQDHYDFGMRAVKTVISAAGNIKREFPDLDEELIVLRAIRDANVPKFLMEDLKLFNGIVSDLFPKIRDVPVDYGEMELSIREKSTEHGLEDVEGFVNKCIQLYETTVVRHGLMLVGPTLSGKTKCYHILRDALSSLKGKSTPGGVPFEQVYSYVLNPKSITMGQLYGEFDAMTHEWTDGILACLIRAGVAADNSDKKWFVFDGPVDAIWIENMNTVLDDNKKLCLSSGEIIKLTDVMTMMFEVQDLAVASPATVSRCGMVYLEPSILGLSPFVRCWLKYLPATVAPYKEQFRILFHNFMEPCMKFLRKNLKEYVPSSDGSLTFSLLKTIESFFLPFIPREGETIPTDNLNAVAKLVESWFLFSVVWSIGGTIDGPSRKKFDIFLREKIKEHDISMPFPEEGLVFDYRLDDGGVSKTKKGDEDEEDDKKKTKSKIQWVGWMADQPEFAVDPAMRFSDIIVPTIDTVRAHFLLELLVNSNKQVLCVGPTGTGKTLTTSDKLLKGMSSTYLSHFLTFSAQTSANQTQDIIDSKLDKRRKGIFGPPLGKKFILFIDDLNMPALEVYGAQPPIELVRQWMDHSGWYDRQAIGSFRKLVDISFVCAMGPPGGGRNPITPRLQRHFNILSFTELEDTSKERIFSAIISSWLTSISEPEATISTLVQATIKVYSTITTELLPTPTKSHYTFNLRDLSKVFQGMLMVPSSKVKELPSLLKLWCHECGRIFEDRLVSTEDREWFRQLLRSRLSDEFKSNPDEILGDGTLLYGDFMTPNADVKVYDEITDYEKMRHICEEYLDDYNQINTAQMKLVLFLDALRHVCRISRIIRQPLGNALLLGVGGSGRQSLTRLSAHMAEYDLFQIELSKNYGTTEWREDIKTCLMKAGAENTQVVFLFSDTQIKSESMLEDLNNILNSGDVPNIYAFEDLDRIYNEMKPIVQDAGQQPTKSNLFSAYTKRVRSNIHVVICMSPIGEVFRARLRQFPSFVNCCTIDWFSEWPDEALKSVAQNFIQEITEIDNPDTIPGLVNTCVVIHQSVAQKSLQYKAELSRYNYVTPTSYLELLGIFGKMAKIKQTELSTQRNRTKIGLDKLLTTANEVGKLQEDLEEMQPQLEAAQIETEQTMEQIKKDSIVANETKAVVQKEEEEATVKAEKTQAIADDAQKDLDEALPMLDAALASLKSLNKNDVVEVRALQRPPMGVKLVIDAVCIMKEVKPKKVPGEKPGVKIDDYWEPGKATLQEPAKFLDSLYKFDRDNIPDNVISKIQPYIDNPDFSPENIAKVSKACTSICQWVRAMHKYHFVSKAVAPKRAALKEAKESLDTTLKLLNDAKSRLREVEEGIAALQAKYEECVAKKEELKDKCDLCAARLTRAEKLIGGLADEKVRWKESVDNFNKLLINVIGDVMVSAGVVAYLGSFTGEYRAALVESWQKALIEFKVPHTDAANLFSILGDPVKIRNWQISGLPRDTLSVENGIIVQFSRRWPLFIDPQGQANKWVKNMEKDNGLDVVKLTDKDFLRSLENAVRFGKPCLLENIAEELDPALEPILLQQTFKQAGSTVIKLGDSVVPYHDDFKFYITTKLPNPHYTPEVSTKVTLVNFTLSPSGLEDQLLGIVVAEERPDLEEAKNALIVSNAKMKQELKEIEDQILYRLSNAEGNPVDDVDLIKVLEASKIKSQEISAKVVDAEKTEVEIDETRSKYIPVAVRTQLLFFCTTDLSNIDPMYQYSLEWYIRIFLGSIASAEKSDDLEERIHNINEYFTFSLYSNVCRSLFEKHKLLFSFLLCARILQHDNQINIDEWRHLIAGAPTMPQQLPNPAPDWISERMWIDLLTLSTLPCLATLPEEFENHIDGFKRMFDSNEPHKEPLPGHWATDLDDFQKLLVIKGVRSDKLTNAMQDFVSIKLGQRFIEPQTAELGLVFKDSSTTTPLIFVLSAGTDPAADLYKFAEEMKFHKKLSAISLGQGQGPRAEAMMKQAMDRGRWVFFQNCHLSPSWMPTLERLIEQIDGDKVHRDFRLWLTSMPSPKFPVSVLQNSSKMTMEPPRGIKANLLKSFIGFNDDFLNGNTKQSEFKFLLFSLCVFHGVTLERRKFGALGFNIPYEFTDGDLRICVSQLSMFLDEYSEIPFKVLKYTAGHINYGGRVTDDWDRRCIMNILDDYYCQEALSETYSFSESGIFHQLSPEANYKEYMDYVRSLPINSNPEIFGLHDNANITFAMNETYQLLSGILKLQPKSSSGAGSSREDVVEEIVKKVIENVPKPFPITDIMEKYPVKYTESMNTVLVQEVIRYNRLLKIIHSSLQDLRKALKGLVVMSEALETMFNSIFNNEVPEMWAAKAYPSLKPLAAWVVDLEERMKFIQGWIEEGIPPVFWISGFFFPQAFLTGTLQNYARKAVISIDTISFDFKVMKDPYTSYTSRPDNGCYIRGLFVEGARWDMDSFELAESRPKELYTDMPVMWLIPTADRKQPESGIYFCPVYKTLTRAGTLSTTGHSTNYVIAVEVPSSKPQFHWIKRAVALLCALNY